MKSGIRILAIVVALAAAACAQTPSIADLARQQRAKPKPKNQKVWTNADFPDTSPATKAETEKPVVGSAPPGEAAPAQEEKKDAAAEKQKALAELQKHLTDQQAEIAKLEKEISALETQRQNRATAYYADVGTRLRDNTKWMEAQQKNDKELADKKQALADAQNKLSDLQEQARKAGIPHPYD